MDEVEEPITYGSYTKLGVYLGVAIGLTIALGKVFLAEPILVLVSAMLVFGGIFLAMVLASSLLRR